MAEPEAILMAVRNHLNDADYYVRTKDYEKARVSAEQAIDIAREQQHSGSLAAAYYALAAVIWSSGGDSAESHRYASLAAEHCKPNTETDLMVRTLVARLKVARGNFTAAFALNEDLLDYYTQTADLRGRADVLRSMGDLHIAKAEMNRAHERYLESLSIYSTLNDPINHAGLLLSLGTLMYKMERKTEARDYWRQARDLAEAHGYPNIVESAEEGLKLA